MAKFYITLCSVWGILYIIIFFMKMNHSDYWFLGFIIAPTILAAISITSGIIGVTKHNALFTPALINGLAVMIGIFILTGTLGFFKAGEFWDIPVVFSGGIAVFLVTFITALVTRLIIVIIFSIKHFINRG